ncbi:HCL173Cp [Eremothecium sinecaudum]|uniref:HCL173Cp n=1 Tax=Eremothecium sinecaudum TaxID=45286 RepID=A0A109UYG0_9SACH|nr:HCL173Cp [Eremothecium sinecaudum]AMD19978.1 HCL173Cp [Eremothecium sinecaudum]
MLKTVIEKKRDQHSSAIELSYLTPQSGSSVINLGGESSGISTTSTFARTSSPIKPISWWKKALYSLWNGPVKASDEPPKFHRRWEVFEALDDIPSRFQARFSNFNIRFVILIVYCCIWFVVCLCLLYPSLIALPYFKNDTARHKVISLSCNSQWNWKGKNNACGLNAEQCGPFENQEVIIKCPALCDRSSWVFSSIEVGNQSVKYKSYAIGGGRIENPTGEDLTYPYRGDSFPCAAAIHAGLISSSHGGCVRLKMTGPQNSFPSAKGSHRTESVEFDSFFPSSFVFKEMDGNVYGCKDPRLGYTLANISFSILVFYLYESVIGFWVVVIAGYWTLILALDPPITIDPYDRSTIYNLWSMGFGRLLPLCFVLYCLWKASVHTLASAFPVIKLILWLPLFWVGVLNNVTFDRLPLDRLTPKDLKQLAGAFAVVVILCIVLISCAVIQAYNLWKAGKLRKYLKIYLLIAVGMIILSVLPGLHLRLHHYLLGIILLPGCATKSGSAYMFQGLLIGLIISGVGRWGFASIVESEKELSRGEAGLLTAPPILEYSGAPYAVSWQPVETTDGMTDEANTLDGYSLLINDVEYYVGTNTTVDVSALLLENEHFARVFDRATEANPQNLSLYLRVSRASIKDAEIRGDYSKAGYLKWPEGIWTQPEPGVT